MKAKTAAETGAGSMRDHDVPPAQVDASGDQRSPADLRRENWTLQCQLAETRHALEVVRGELSTTLHSRSWRATQFLRRAANSIRRILPIKSTIAVSSQLRRLSDFGSAPAHGDGRLLLVDVTELAIANLQGGIQHTVKGILSEWLLAAPAGWQIVPVQLTAEGEYVSASEHLGHIFGDLRDKYRGRRIEGRAGDVFVGLDLLRDHHLPLRRGLKHLKQQGVHVQMVVYDLLPVDMPECVPEWIAEAFALWLDVVGDEADGVSCISDTVAQRFEKWLSGRMGRNSGIAISSFRLGVPQHTCQLKVRRTLSDASRPSFLMVGTVEPRKGYADAIDAFDALWAAQQDCQLTIVGRYGWGLPELAARLDAHPEMGARLNWKKRATDEEVQACYEAADALVFSSYGEGFGLPIIEAAQHGLPLILRDLPEFREVAGAEAFYFTGSAEGLEHALRQWMELARAGQVRTPSPGIALTWQQSAAQLLESFAAAAARNERFANGMA